MRKVYIFEQSKSQIDRGIWRGKLTIFKWSAAGICFNFDRLGEKTVCLGRTGSEYFTSQNFWKLIRLSLKKIKILKEKKNLTFQHSYMQKIIEKMSQRWVKISQSFQQL